MAADTFATTQRNSCARILAVADIYDALAAKRPYRDAMPLEQVVGILGKDAPRAIDPVCVEALKTALGLGSLSQALNCLADRTSQRSLLP